MPPNPSWALLIDEHTARLRNAPTFHQEVVAGILTLASRLLWLTDTIQIIDPGGVVWQVAP